MSAAKFEDILAGRDKFETDQAVVRHAMNDMANIPGAGQEEPAGKKLGEGHLAAMGRLGAHELTQALAAFPDSNIKPMEEPGVLGNPTPQIVTQEMGGLRDIGSTARDFSLQDILDAPSQPTPPSQQQDRDMGREM
jgi:hypothetical protein